MAVVAGRSSNDSEVSCFLTEVGKSKMSAPMGDAFSEWLSKKLLNINPDVDLDVFVTYLTGILDTEDQDREEQEESIQGFLAEITVRKLQKVEKPGSSDSETQSQSQARGRLTIFYG